MCELSDNPLDRKVLWLRKFIVKYQEEIDMKVNFRGLQDAIDAIDKAMLGYEGEAKKRLDKVRDLNSTARLTYEMCVGLIFEWSVSASETYRTILLVIQREILTKSDRKEIFDTVSKSLSSGLPKIRESLKLLQKEVLVKVTELSDLFKSIEHDFHFDFGENGFYGKNIQKDQKDPKKQLEGIERFFQLIPKNLWRAQKVIGDVIKALKEDRNNVVALEANCENLSDCTYAENLEGLQILCQEYAKWHGYDP